VIKQEWQNIFNKNHWKRFTSFNGSLPYAYVMPKNKDLEKIRPIVSYSVHPLRPMLRRASRALRYMLKEIPHTHFNLDRTDTFINDTLNIYKLFKNEGFEHVMAVAGDIKQMYTELPHDFILEAVDWLCDTFFKQTRRQHVSAPRFARTGAHGGRDTNDATMVTFSLKELREIIEFDLKNAIFTVGDIMLQQTIGIPMGSPISPILAVVMCAYSEHKHTMERKQLNKPIVRGLRYVDDAIMFAGYNPSSNLISEGKALTEIESVMVGAYHKNLIVEKETNLHYIPMLESILDTTTEGFSAKFWHKNAESIRMSNTQTFLKFQNFYSYSPYTAKRGVLISTFMRMRHASSSVNDMVKVLPMFIKELKLLRYPKGIVTSALSTLHSRGLEKKDEYWKGVITKIVDEW
jgi:hypothetical protein